MSRSSAVRRLVIATGLGLLTACSSSTGTSGQSSLSNPAATTQKLQAVDTTFKTPAFNSLRGLSARFIPTSPPAPASGLGALIQATLPRASTQTAVTAQQVLALQRGLFSGAIGFSVLPPTVLGRTYVLTTPVSSYVYDPSRTGAPANGVRFILYAVDPVGYFVLSPLTETGYADLIDRSMASANALEIKVVWGGTTYADYTVTGTYTSSTSAAVSIAGFVTDGTTRVDFSITYAVTDTTLSEQSIIDAASLAFHLVFNVTGTTSVSGTVTTASITLHISMTIGSEVVTADGTITGTSDSHTFSVSGTIPVEVNGQTFAIISISNTGRTIAAPNGGALNPDQEKAVEELLFIGGEIDAYITRLVAPFVAA